MFFWCFLFRSSTVELLSLSPVCIMEMNVNKQTEGNTRASFDLVVRAHRRTCVGKSFGITFLLMGAQHLEEETRSCLFTVRDPDEELVAAG